MIIISKSFPGFFVFGRVERRKQQGKPLEPTTQSLKSRIDLMITQTQTVGSYLAPKIAIKSNNSHVASKKGKKLILPLTEKNCLIFNPQLKNTWNVSLTSLPNSRTEFVKFPRVLSLRPASHKFSLVKWLSPFPWLQSTSLGVKSRIAPLRVTNVLGRNNCPSSKT